MNFNFLYSIVRNQIVKLCSFKNIVLFSLVVLQITLSYAQTIKLENYTVRNGLPSQCVYSIDQDTFGFIWIGTMSGLVRYDGKEFINFSVKDGLNDNEILKVFIDKRNQLWLFDMYGFNVYSIYDGFNIRIQHLKKIESPHAPVCIEEIGDSIAIYFNTTLDLYNVNNLSIHTRFENNKNLYYKQKSVTKVWNYDTYNTLHNTKNKSTIKFQNIISPLNEEYNKQNLFFLDYTNKLLISYDIVNNKLHTSVTIDKSVRSKCIDQNGNIILSTDNGVEIYSHQLHNSNQHILEGYLINFIFEDNRGNYWIATANDGLFLYRKNNMYSYDSKKSSVPLAKTLHVHQGTIYAGNFTNSFTQLSKNNVNVHSINHSSNNNRVIEMITHKGELLFFCDFGVFSATNKVANIECIKDISYLNTSSIVVSTCLGIYVYNLDNNKITDTLHIGRSNCNMVDANGNIWIGDYRSLYRYKNAKYDTMKLTDSYCKIYKIECDAQGHIWVATGGYGIFILDTNGNIIKKLGEKEGLASDVINTMYIDSKGRVWCGSEKGVNQISISDNNTHIKLISTYDGLLSDEIYAFQELRDTLYISTGAGISIYDIQHKNNNENITLYWLQRIANGKMLTNNDCVFSPNTNSIKLKFIGLSYSAVENIYYKYRISRNGKFDPWQYTKESNIELSSLQAADYKIEIIAYNRFNPKIASNTITWQFTINAYIYQKLWFWLLVLLTLGVLVSYLFYSRYNRIKREEQEKLLLKNKLSDLTMRSLQSQMNPHFLFNSLNTVQHFITGKDEASAINYLSDFGTLMRNILENSRQEKISIDAEIQFLERYIQLEQTRFNHKFDYCFNVDTNLDTEEIYIPSMLLQPLVENAIKHGVSGLKDRKGIISISFDLVELNVLQIKISDNGLGSTHIAQKKNHTSTALEIIRERIQLLQKNDNTCAKFTLHIHESGTDAILILPI